MARTATPAAVGALIAGGRAAEALPLARSALGDEPDNPQWLHLLGVALHLTGASDEAARALERSVRIAPGDALAWNSYGAVQTERGELDSAEAALREALRLKSDSLEARFNLAVALRRKGDAAGAIAELDRVLAAKPDFAAATLERATLLAERDARAGLAAFEPILARFPGDPKVLAHAAAAWQRAGEDARALELARRAAARPPADPRDLAALIRTFTALERPDEAGTLAATAATLAPDSPDIRACVGDALAAAGRHAEARVHYAFVAQRRARDPDALERLGVASLAAGDAAAAATALREHLRLAPQSRSGAQSLAVALGALGEIDAARDVLAGAIAAGHDDAELLSVLAHHKLRTCDWDGMEALVSRLRERAVVPGPHPAHPPVSLYLAEVGAREQRVWAENWARGRLRPRPALTTRTARLAAGARIKVGFLSGDFRNHATARLIAAMVERHDRARLEFIAYSYGADDGSGIRARLARGFDRFVEIAPLSARAAAERIHGDGVDVLLDLTGYVEGARLDVLAWRPAPVQGHFLVYPGTLGADCVDFFVADALTVPPGGDGAFSERIVRMPVCYQPNEPWHELGAPPSREACGLPPAGIVLCSLNQSMKISAPVFGRWCELLRTLPGSCLWLLAFDPHAERNLVAAAGRNGIDPARLVFAPRVAHEAHLARLQHADIALDTFPYTSHTTASDALRAGVPLLTTRGETFASRVAASVLSAGGCADWIFDDADRAFAATLAMARDAGALARARERARAARASPLFDADRFTRDFASLLAGAAAGLK